MTVIATWSIINNEISYIKDIVDHHLQWADYMYVLDTGSTDGTLEYLKDKAILNTRLVVEEYHTKYVPQYELDWHEMVNPFPEVTVRNFALSRVEKLLNPDWLVQLDGDEVWTSETRDIILTHPNAMTIGHSTINPVSKLEELPIEQRGGYSLYDPHVRIWKPKNNIIYMHNPAFKEHHYHCIPTVRGWNGHLFHHPLTKFVDNPIDFHIHWMYGSKIDAYYSKKAITKQEIVNSQFTNKYSHILPNLFWEKRQQWLSTQGKHV